MRDFGDNRKHSNIHIKGVGEGERLRDCSLLKEIMTAHFSMLVKEKTHNSRELSPKLDEPKKAKTNHN